MSFPSTCGGGGGTLGEGEFREGKERVGVGKERSGAGSGFTVAAWGERERETLPRGGNS